jgi:hypothetical protein
MMLVFDYFYILLESRIIVLFPAIHTIRVSLYRPPQHLVLAPIDNTLQIIPVADHIPRTYFTAMSRKPGHHHHKSSISDEEQGKYLERTARWFADLQRKHKYGIALSTLSACYPLSENAPRQMTKYSMKLWRKSTD